MNEKLTLLALLGAFSILGYPIGCLVANFTAASRWLARIGVLVGAVAAFVGIVAAHGDHRFYILADIGIGLQIAGLVNSSKIRKPVKRRTVDLWASHK